MKACRMMLVVLMLSLVAVPAVMAETLKVGAILAVTGPAAFLGGPESRTIGMLADEVNQAGGING
ncbi:MAG: ABC transporter substrate-binding protein, partial [Desulfofustis sp.]|nr:ABC transporter substrate-binding protein [Desulfofustis sp.]